LKPCRRISVFYIKGVYAALPHTGVISPIFGFKRRLFAESCRKMRKMLRGYGELVRKIFQYF